MVAASSCQILNLLPKFSLKHFCLKHLCQNVCEIVLILYGDGTQSVQPKSNKLECITTSWLVAKPIRGIVLRFDPRLCNITRGLIEAFWYHFPEKMQSNKSRVYFALVTVQSCAVYKETWWDSIFAPLHNAKLQAVSHCCLYIWVPNIHQFNQTSGSLTEVLNCQNLLGNF